MTADEIKALVEQLRSSGYASHFALNQLARKAGEVLETLSDQLLAKTELANLYAASLRKVEREVEALTQENQRLRLEFRADCEKHAEELFKVQRDAERYRWLRDFGKDGVNIKPPCEHVNATIYSHHVGSIPATRCATGAELDLAIDAALSQTKEQT